MEEQVQGRAVRKDFGSSVLAGEGESVWFSIDTEVVRLLPLPPQVVSWVDS